MNLSIRTNPYSQWLVESRTGRKRKVLACFGDERDAKKFLAGLTQRGHRSRAGETPAAISNLPTVACVLLLGVLTAPLSVCAGGGHSISAGAGVVSVSEAGLKPPATSTGPAESDVHPSSGFSRPASGPVRGDGVGNRNAQVSDTARPQPNAGGGNFAPAVGGNQADLRAQRGLREETGLMASDHGRRSSDAFKGVEQSALSDQPGGMPGTFSRLLAFVIVTGSVCAGLLAVASCALSGRLEGPR